MASLELSPAVAAIMILPYKDRVNSTLLQLYHPHQAPFTKIDVQCVQIKMRNFVQLHSDYIAHTCIKWIGKEACSNKSYIKVLLWV